MKAEDAVKWARESSERSTDRRAPGSASPPSRMALALEWGSPATGAGPALQITIAQPPEATTRTRAAHPGAHRQLLLQPYDSLTPGTRPSCSSRPGPPLARVKDTHLGSRSAPREFHDGAPLTADGRQATLERTSCRARRGDGGLRHHRSGCHAPNTRPRAHSSPRTDPLLPVRMAQMGSQILPARLTTDEGVKELARRPVGTGAYRFVEWVKDERLVMEANRDWWGWEGRKPGVDRVVWKPIPEDFPRLVALEKGEPTSSPSPARSHQIHCRRPGHAHCEHPLLAHGGVLDERHPGTARGQAGPPGPALRARHQHHRQGHLCRLREAV